MKMQDDHGQILVSRALDPRKMISPKIPKKSGVFSPKKQVKGKRKFSDFRARWPLASGLASAGRA